MSQILYLGPSLYFMKCFVEGNFVEGKCLKLFVFFMCSCEEIKNKDLIKRNCRHFSLNRNVIDE